MNSSPEQIENDEADVQKKTLLILGGTFIIPTLITLIAAYYFLWAK